MSKLVAAVGALLLLAGVVLTYLSDEVLDPAAAGDNAAQALADDPGLREAIAPKIAETIDGVDPTGLAPDDVDAIATALDNDAASEAFGEAVTITVEDLTGPDPPDPLSIDLGSVAAEAAPGIELPGIGEVGLDLPGVDTVTGQFDSLQIDLEGVDWLFDLLDVADALEPLALPALGLGILILLLSIPLARRPAEGLLAAGVSVAVAACLGIATLLICRTLTGSAFDSPTSDAVLAIWDALAGDLLTMLIIGAAAGLVLAAGGWLAMRSGRALGPHSRTGPPPGRRTSPHAETLRPGRRPDPPPGPRRPPPPPPPPDPGPLPPDQDFERRRYR